MDEKITYEEMLEQLDQKGIRVTNGARRLYVALNNGVKAEVLGNGGPATISLVDGMIVVEEQTLH
ncbi:hypothetical protein [Klebsiella variicola]|uniref:hypothetical protein n=1 Tax=Klebsiella variicola TaxID=244366 RepID=UPI0028BDAED3|nr:hypothetical protein [Klebsiella variicola]